MEKKYAHILRPWEVFYTSDYYNTELPKQTILEYIKSKNADNLDGVAVNNYGDLITYGELFEQIDTASRVLTASGIMVEDRILSLVANLSDTPALFYGASQIGAVSDYIDPRPDSVDLNISAKKVLSLAEAEKAKSIVALDQCYLGMIKPIENELKELGVRNVITLSPSDSMSARGKFNYLGEQLKFYGFKGLKAQMAKSKAISEKLKEAKKSAVLDVLSYGEMKKNCNYTTFERVPYDGSRIATIVHTSGTSSARPKPIPLTVDNLNAYAHQTDFANMPMERGDKALQILPYFAAFGLCGVVHGGFSHGCELIQIPEFTPVHFGKLILKYKPQIIIGTPTWFVTMMSDPVLQNADLSFLKMVTYGGDSMEPSDELKVNKFLWERNCPVKLTKGHGMSETCGCASYATNEYNEVGTMGIPMPGVTYSIVDPETKEFVEFTDDKDYIEGELAISSKTTTPGILDGNVIVEHHIKDGIDFIYTKDIARMYKNGVMMFLTRSDRSFTRFDGFKYRTFEVEKMIKNIEGIKYCIISPYYDEDRFGNMPIVDIVLDESTDDIETKIEIVKTIIDKCFIQNENASSRQIPTKFRFREELPYTKMSKVDFNALIKEGLENCDVTVDIEETNISVERIDVKAYKRGKVYTK